MAQRKCVSFVVISFWLDVVQSVFAHFGIYFLGASQARLFRRLGVVPGVEVPGQRITGCGLLSTIETCRTADRLLGKRRSP